MKGKKVVILGMGPTWVECPYDKDKEIWGINYICRKAKRIDLLWNLHTWKDTPKDLMAEILQRRDIPIMALEPYDGLNVTIFPLEEIIHHFNTAYLADTVAEMIAYAIYKGYSEIDLFGIDHFFTGEYVESKGCVEYWVGRADQCGIKVGIPKGSAICKTIDGSIYGRDMGFASTYYRMLEKKNREKEPMRLLNGLKSLHPKSVLNGLRKMAEDLEH